MESFYKRQIDETNIIEELKEKLVDCKKNDAEPKAILLGGIPGAGKTGLCKGILQQHKESEYVIIDVDEYRKYSPVFTQKDAVPTSKMVELSIRFCNQVASQLLEYALKNRKNIIINTSLRDTDLMLNFINNKFIPAGYHIDICILATPLEECILSSQERYERQIEEKEFPRFTTIEFMNESEVQIDQTIKELEKMRNIGAIEVYKRGKNEKEFPIKVYDSEDELKKYPNAIVAIEDCKRQEKQKRTVQEQLTRIQELYKKRKKRGADSEEFEVLDKIKEYYKKEPI